jgi:methylated-DNA-[protein]-cysteine S-methyltransferase
MALVRGALSLGRRVSEALHELTVASPIGPLTLVGSARGLRAVRWESAGVAPDSANPILRETARQLDEYFAARRTSFDLSLDLRGTRFQLLAWTALAEIPYGTTVSYRDQARRVGRPRAIRAIGAANGCNPLPIILPCHRVVGSNGALTGYGGGLEAKRWLLAFEAGAAPAPHALGTT